MMKGLLSHLLLKGKKSLENEGKTIRSFLYRSEEEESKEPNNPRLC